MDGDDNLKKALDKLDHIIDRRDYYMEKKALKLLGAIGSGAKTLGKGVLSNMYAWTGKGIGQLGRLAGKAMGAKSVTSVRGPDGTIYRIGDTIKGADGATKKITVDNIKTLVNENNALLSSKAKDAGKIFDNSQGYSLVDETLGAAKGGGFLGSIGNFGTRLSRGGDKLVQWGDDIDRWYKADLFGKGLGNKGVPAFLGRNSLRLAAGLSPFAIAPAAEYMGDDSITGKALGAVNTVINYGSPMMLAGNGIMKGVEAYGRNMTNAALDGASIGAGMIANGLADANSWQYIGGAFSPSSFAQKVNDKAQAEIAKIRANPAQYLQ